MKLNIKSTKFFVSIFFVLLCMSVFFAVATAGKGAKIVAIERQIKALENQNRELKSLVVNQNSLKLVAEKAAERGLVKGQNVLYWNQDLSVAKLP